MFDYLKLGILLLQGWNKLAALIRSAVDQISGERAAVSAGKEAAEREEAIARDAAALPVDPDEPDEFMRKDA